jgi:GTP-binding protein LepA
MNTEQKQENIRNFAIIAHIDHGKSTLSDRMLEVTGTVEARNMQEQVLDSMELERERGITIKMQPVRMEWKGHVLNLIDTPGHIDFAYEVSRALSAIEGAILLVDATQGIEAQTMSTLAVAKELGLKIIPALSKVDSPLARVDDVRMEVALTLGIEEDEILLVSGKTGEGVEELLNKVLEQVPAPSAEVQEPRALIFDFKYSDHKGIVLFVRVTDGEIKTTDALKFGVSRETFKANEVGIFTPEESPKQSLTTGEIGYIVTGIKKPGVVNVGDTVLSTRSTAPPLGGYHEPDPVIWASVYPESQDDLANLRQSLERLRLMDSSLSYEEEASGTLGRGFRCGFLGMLHMEIITERLRREFNLELIVTMPTTVYEVTHKNGKVEDVYSPMRFPDDNQYEAIREPWASLSIIVPSMHISGVMQLLHEHEADVVDTNTMPDGRTELVAHMALREMMRNFFDKLKNVSSGFASLSYKPVGMRPANVTRLDILIAEEVSPAFTRIVSRNRTREEGDKMVERLEKVLPKQQFVLKIQAKAGGSIIASRKKSAMRKDVTAKLYGGDVSRKNKLLDKQKKGKKAALARGTGSVHIPHDTFIKVLRND